MSPDYQALVALARDHFCKQIAKRERLYRRRAAWRKQKGWPTLAIVGAGESGKDEVARVLTHGFPLHYEGGTSRIFAPMVAYCLRQPMEVAYASRRKNREYWFQWMTEYRKGDPPGVARLQMAISDFCVGIRGEEELRACVAEGVVDVPVWVSRAGCNDGAHEVSMELVRELGGAFIDNDSDLPALERSVVALATSLGLPFNNRWLYEVNCGQEEEYQTDGKEEEVDHEEGSEGDDGCSGE